jgi:UTP--glucose-1-phosphate uridylyltransferase
MNSSAAFAPFERKMRDAGLPDLAIRTFRHAYEQLRSGARGTLSSADIEPVDEVPSAENLGDAREVGRAALARTAVVKLNGGLGTSMGMTRAKSLLVVKEGLTFLDVTARQILELRRRNGALVPLLLMNSFRTREDSLALLARYGDISAGFAPDFLQHRVPRILAESLGPVSWPADPSLEWCPPGHGDIYAALVTSGTLEALLARGFRTAFVSNADNLGAVLDLDILGWFVESGAPFAMEVKERSEADRKGGHLALLKDGRLALREIAQCPEQERASFEDVRLHRFFNTNNVWLDLPTLARVLEERDGVLGLPMIRNEKVVDPVDESSPRVIQLETAMGAAISVFEGARAILVPGRRFSPVKTTDDLLAVRSDAFELTEDWRVEPTPEAASLVVDLDPAHYRRIGDFEARFPSGAPSLRRCRRLAVRGDFRFGRGVVLEGEVQLEASGAEGETIPDGARLSG